MTFEQVYEKYFRDVYRYILGLSGDAHLAEEITADTFFKALRSIDQFRGDCDIRVWLCQIAKNAYYTHLQHSRRTLRAVKLNPSDQIRKSHRAIYLNPAHHWSEDRSDPSWMQM